MPCQSSAFAFLLLTKVDLPSLFFGQLEKIFESKRRMAAGAKLRCERDFAVLFAILTFVVAVDGVPNTRHVEKSTPSTSEAAPKMATYEEILHRFQQLGTNKPPYSYAINPYQVMQPTQSL